MDERIAEESVHEYYREHIDELEELTDSMAEDKETEAVGDTINVGAMLNRLRQKAKEVGSASVKKAAEAVEELKAKAVQEETDAKEIEEQIEEISIDIEDIKQEIFECVKSAMAAADIDGSVQGAIEKSGAAMKSEDVSAELKAAQTKLAEVAEGLDNVKKRLSAMQQSDEKGFEVAAKRSEKLTADVNDVRNKTDNVITALNGISKLSDSVFDLKNAQANMKSSIDGLNMSLKRLKKRVTAGVAILSVISVIVALLQILVLLS